MRTKRRRCTVCTSNPYNDKCTKNNMRTKHRSSQSVQVPFRSIRGEHRSSQSVQVPFRSIRRKDRSSQSVQVPYRRIRRKGQIITNRNPYNDKCTNKNMKTINNMNPYTLMKSLEELHQRSRAMDMYYSPLSTTILETEAVLKMINELCNKPRASYLPIRAEIEKKIGRELKEVEKAHITETLRKKILET